jgi:hypothetical protein
MFRSSTETSAKMPSATEQLSSDPQSLGASVSPPSSQTTLVLALFGRLTWMMFGPISLAVTTFLVVSKGGGWFTPADFAHFAVLGAMLLGRCLEFGGGNPQTAEGQPATRAHLRRYLLVAGVIALVVWVAANIVGNHRFTR